MNRAFERLQHLDLDVRIVTYAGGLVGAGDLSPDRLPDGSGHFRKLVNMVNIPSGHLT